MNSEQLKVQLAVRKKHVKGKGAYQSVTPRVRIQMAYDRESRHKVLGRQYQLHPRSVARNCLLVAGTYLEMQSVWLDHLERICTENPPLIVCKNFRWDEKKEVVEVNLVPGASVTKDAVESLVSKCRIVIKWKSSRTPALCLDILTPPAPLMSNSAENIFSAVHHHPLIGKTIKQLTAIQATATWKSHTDEADGAHGNDRYHAHASTTASPNIRLPDCFQEMHLCSNHGNQLTATHFIVSLQQGLSSTIYTSNLFFAYNGHFTRVQNVVKPCVVRFLGVSYDPPPPGSELYTVQFMEFKMRQTKFVMKYDTDGTAIPSRHSVALQTALDEFRGVFNSSWWCKPRGPGPRWVHHCRRDGTCCAGSTDAERLKSTQDRSIAAIHATLLRKRPNKDAPSKWNKLLPSFDFWDQGVAPHGMLQTLVEAGMKQIGPSYAAAAAQAQARGVNVNQLADDDLTLSFHQVAGVRLQRVLGLLGDEDTLFRVRVTVVLTEVCRPLATFFQVAAEGKLRRNRPLLCDVASPATSPVVQSLQYISGFLRGSSPAFRMIWQHRGHETMHAWAQERPQEVACVRRSSMFLVAAIKIRHGHLLEEPYSFTSFIDDRSPPLYKGSVKRRFKARPRCCHRPGLAQQLKDKPDLDLDSEEFHMFIFCWALTVLLSLSDVERLHAVNSTFNRLAGGGVKWCQLAAHAVNHSSQCLLRRREKEQDENNLAVKGDEAAQQTSAPHALVAPASATSHSSSAAGTSSSTPSKRASRRNHMELPGMSDVTPAKKKAKVGVCEPVMMMKLGVGRHNHG